MVTSNKVTNAKLRDVSIPFTIYKKDTSYKIASGRIMVMIIPDDLVLGACWLNIKVTAPDDQGLAFKIAIGNWDDTEVNPYYPSEPDQATIDAHHLLITGSNDKCTIGVGQTEIFEYDIVKALPKLGDSNYKKGAFVLLLAWDDSTWEGIPFNEPQWTTGGMEMYLTGRALLGVRK